MTTYPNPPTTIYAAPIAGMGDLVQLIEVSATAYVVKVNPNTVLVRVASVSKPGDWWRVWVNRHTGEALHDAAEGPCAGYVYRNACRHCSAAVAVVKTDGLLIAPAPAFVENPIFSIRMERREEI